MFQRRGRTQSGAYLTGEHRGLLTFSNGGIRHIFEGERGGLFYVNDQGARQGLNNSQLARFMQLHPF